MEESENKYIINSIQIGLKMHPQIVLQLDRQLNNKISKFVLLTDSTLEKSMQFGELVNYWKSYCNKPLLIYSQLPQGKSAKTRKIKEEVEDFLFANECGRDTCLIALGGGSICDLIGFVASTYMRGIPLVLIPTSLLAMADAGIGGKNGLDLPWGKNLLGTFWQPSAIFIDISYISTLPLSEFSSGMAEIIKIAINHDKSLFHFLEAEASALLATAQNPNSDSKKLLFVVEKAAKLKASIVSCDVRDVGVRESLNFGHSIGQAIEAMEPCISHGYAVAVGMVYETIIAVNRGICEERTLLSRMVQLLKAFNLPTSLKDLKWENGFNERDFVKYLKLDKKARESCPRIVLPISLERWKIEGVEIIEILKSVKFLERRSHFLSLNVEDVRPFLVDLDEIIFGMDAVELRVDCLKSIEKINFADYVKVQFGLLKNALKEEGLKLIYTFRTKGEGGCPAMDLSEATIVDLIILGIGLNPEYVDIELHILEKYTDELQPILKGSPKTSLIVSTHQPFSWDSAQAETIYKKSVEAGGSIVKMVSTSPKNDLESNKKLEMFRISKFPAPGIFLNLGELGSDSRASNVYFTPLTHPKLPAPAAPGQLSLSQLLPLRISYPNKSFYLFGSQIRVTHSPAFHNHVFNQMLGLVGYSYELKDTADFEEILGIIKKDSGEGFGGASVTIPYKETIIPYLDKLSESASIIGAVNTIYREAGTGVLCGENTDWIGIRKAIENLGISGSNAEGAALVLGAGGTARAAIYALAKISQVSKIWIYNRTKARAVGLAKHFDKSLGNVKLRIVDNLEDFCQSVHIVVDTLPWDASKKICNPAFLNLVFPKNGGGSGILIKLAVSECPEKDAANFLEKMPNVKLGTALDVFLYQAIYQSEIWTDIKPNFKYMKNFICNKPKSTK